MKRIGILTWHNTINYGGALQALSLQEVLKSLGYDVEFLCIREDFHVPSFSLCSLHKYIYRFLFRNKKRIAKTNTFIKRNMRLSSCNISRNEISGFATIPYDVVIAGSDQIWNYQYNPDYELFLLPFIDDSVKKISYASSFGVQNIDENHKLIFTKYLKRFAHLSVREKSGKRIIEKLLPNKKVSIVLDPTLLIRKESWLKYIKKRANDENYILCYIMPQGRKIQKRLKQVARKTAKNNNCKVYYCGQREYYKFNLFEKNFIDIGPDDFLSLIYYSKGVVTNSFHGVAFSINMNKLTIPVLDHKNDLGINSRVLSFLDSLDLRNLVLYSDGDYYNTMPKVDYNLINQKLDKYRNYSIAYLRNAIES